MSQCKYPIREVRQVCGLPDWASLSILCRFLHETMRPYEDTEADVRRGILDALEPSSPLRNFVLIAGDGELAGALVMLGTRMQGYIPPNLLLFVAVDPSLRGQGIGGALVRRAQSLCHGPIKLHVEYENPAKRLYERLGFTTKYAEMRWGKA